MFYNNAICDGCGNNIAEGDDVVVCPECGTPQHRHCYDKENKCVNEHLHAENFVWEAPVSPELPAVINNAPAQDNTAPVAVNSINPFEAACLYGVQSKPDDEFDGVRVRDAAVYIQQNSRKYINKFITKKDKLTWNWGAFFFSSVWFFFRKLYKVGFIFLVLTTAVNITLSTYVFDKHGAEFDTFMAQVEQMYTFAQDYDASEESQAEYDKLYAENYKSAKVLMPYIALYYGGTFLLPGIIAALIANKLYRKKMLNDIAEARQSNPGPDLLRGRLVHKGGISLLAGGASWIAAMYLPQLILNAIDAFVMH